MTQDGVKCAFYVLNDTGENLARLENLTLTLAARSRNNVIARGAFNSLRVNLRKGRYAIVKLTLEATEALDFQGKKCNNENDKAGRARRMIRASQPSFPTDVLFAPDHEEEKEHEDEMYPERPADPRADAGADDGAGGRGARGERDLRR